MRKKIIYKNKPIKKQYPEIPEDYLESIPYPQIKFMDSEQYRIINQKPKNNQRKSSMETQNSKQEEEFKVKKEERMHKKHQIVNDKYIKPYRREKQKDLNSDRQTIPDIRQRDKIKYDNSQQQQQSEISQQQQQQKDNKSREVTIFQKQRQKEQQTKNIKIQWNKKTRIFRINLIFYNLLKNTLKETIELRRSQAEKRFKDNLTDGINQLLDWQEDILNESLKNLINNTTDFNLILGQESNNNKKKKMIKGIVSDIISSLIKNFKFDQVFKFELLELSKVLTNSYSFPPKNYLSKFEAQRLPFTKFGSYGKLEKNQQIMLFMVFIFIRGALFNTVLKVWENHPNQEDRDQIFLIQKNSIIISSIIHDIIVKWISKNLPAKKRDDEYLQQVSQYNSYPLSDNVQDIKDQNKKFADYILIEGVMNQSILSRYITNEKGSREDWVNKLEDDILKFTTGLVDKFNQMEEDDRLRRKRDRLIEMIDKYYIVHKIRMQQNKKKKQQQQ